MVSASDLQNIIYRFFEETQTARILVDGHDSGTTIVYEIDGLLQLRNLLPELPPFIRLDNQSAEYSFDEERWEELDDEDVNIYFLLDPRRIFEVSTQVEESQPTNIGDRIFEISYDAADLGINLLAEGNDRFDQRKQGIRAAQIDVSRTGAISRVIQMGLEPQPEHIELRFAFSG